MPSPVELTLSSLLPTISALPPDLVELSVSLLAQSRAKASTLKPEEEIARTYACCHIACQRLGHKLALEIARPAPPVKPKVYNKLHSYFNSVLATPKTPKRAAPPQQSATSNASTPRSRNTLRNGDATPAKDSTPSAKRAHGDAEDHLPSDTMPLIRYICKALEKPELAPHVFAGVQSVFNNSRVVETPRKRRRTSAAPSDTPSATEDSIPPLVISVFCAAYEKAYGSGPDRDGDLQGKALATVEEYRSRNAQSLTSHRHEQLAGSPVITAVPSDWRTMEWYQNIPSAQSSADAPGQEPEDVNNKITTRTKPASKTPLRRKEKHDNPDANEDLDDKGAAGLLPGLGTMFQPAVDWLSRERQIQYAQWKRDISTRLCVLEQAASS